ncbi:hypothetical protein, partial [Rhizobium tropici]
TLKLFAEIRFAHDALLASKLGKKASTNLGAIHWTRVATPYDKLMLNFAATCYIAAIVMWWT